ncbi:ATP-binding protein [Streptomyces sp. NPDC059785]|uniref:ATP-binding protein n=1 Tax=unclassified Streptomyces TaxID=2593676 RepID=UPI00364CBA4D
MSVPAHPSQQRTERGPRPASVALLAAPAAVAAAGAVTAALLAPASARTWTLVTVVVAWVCVVLAAATGWLLLRRAQRLAAARGSECLGFRSQLARQDGESAHLVHVTLPAVAQRIREGASAGQALEGVTPPSEPQLRQVLHTCVAALGDAAAQAARAEAERQDTRRELADATEEAERFVHKTLPAAVAALRAGSSADTVLAELDSPRSALLRTLAESFVRELAHSERRSAAAQAASAKALSRVQAKTVSMLADLREMQDRHTGEVFGDLLRLDHSTSQLGLMTDRLALLMGGRSSRAWNKPIVMESVLRGAVGRIAAYRRVRLHCSSQAAIAGFAAEGVMHLLAELVDNAANFSPPIDEVHVYVNERSAGIVVTIEDSGLKMADAAMRRAEESVSGRITDLASLQGTRLGLAVVGRIALKYGISVNYRPSSHGGTGVVVLLPPQLIAQQRDPGPYDSPREQVAASAVPGLPAAPAVKETPVPPSPPAARPDDPSPAGLPEPSGHDAPRPATGSTLNGLPVRAPGRTMADAEREQRMAAARAAAARETEAGPARDAGSRFGAFHRGRRGGNTGDATPARPGTGPLDDA